MRLQDARLFRVSQGVGFRVQSVVGLRFSLLGDHRGSIQVYFGGVLVEFRISSLLWGVWALRFSGGFSGREVGIEMTARTPKPFMQKIHALQP